MYFLCSIMMVHLSECVKIAFSFFLSMYSHCGVLASWAARHTTVIIIIENITSCTYMRGVNSYLNLYYSSDY